MQSEEAGALEGRIKQIYDMITGEVRLPPKIMVEADTDPYLVMKIAVPQEEYVRRSEIPNIRQLITNPSQELSIAYSHAQRKIVEEMERNRESLESGVPMIRVQMGLKTIEVREKRLPYRNERDEEEELELECIHEWVGLLDMFWLQYNTVLYVLQWVCGFRVKAFLLYDEEVHQRDVYLFMTISQDNLLKMGSNYRIKKEVDYTAFDFFLNDPSSPDQRPLKLNSDVKDDEEISSFLKQVNRFLNAPISRGQNVAIIEEQELSYSKVSKFALYNEELTHLFNYVRSGSEELTPQEKEYLFYHNRRKLNPGVEKMWARVKKRRLFFESIKDILPRYGYTVYEEPVLYEQFSIPSKHSRGLSFFGKLEHILQFRPRVADETGTLRLFTNMEETKLCYMLIKNSFQVNYLTNNGFDILTLSNEFEKFGKDLAGRKTEASKRESVAYQWPWYSFFSNIATIRNYMGDEVAYEIMAKNYVIRFFSAICLPFIFIYTFELLFPEARIGTVNFSALIYSIGFSVYMMLWQQKEREYIDNYSDSIETKIFLSKHRGPYIRNMLTDEENEFAIKRGFLHYLTNIICLVIIGALLTAMGGIFHGCRMLLVEIYESLDNLVVDAVSLPHIIAYSIFFLTEFFFNALLAKRMIRGMTWLKNPSSDEQERWYIDQFTFFYVLGIQLLGPFFLLILEPFSRNNCYSNFCQNELFFYISSRYIIYLIIALVEVGYLAVFNYFLNKLIELKEKKEQEQQMFFQDRLVKLLSRSMEEAKKPEHVPEKITFQVNLTSFALYSTIVPISPVVTLATVMIRYYGLRIGLLYEERRPINKSYELIKFSNQLAYIYIMGVIVVSWANVVSFEFLERNMQSFLELVAKPISEQTIFMFKFAVSAIYALLLLLIGYLAAIPLASLGDDTLVVRRKNKYREYLTSKGALKSTVQRVQDSLPVQTVFRTFNQDLSNHEQIRASLYRLGEEEAQDNGGSQVRLHMD